MIHKITFTGKIPSKKNAHRALNGRVVIERDVQERVEALLWQAREQWVGAPPLKAIEFIQASFFVVDFRADMDNKFTTLLDILTQARVIKNDSMKYIRHTEQFAYRDSAERAVVEIETPESVLPL